MKWFLIAAILLGLFTGIVTMIGDDYEEWQNDDMR